MNSRQLLMVPISILLLGTGNICALAESGPASQLAIDGAWVRAMPPSQRSTAAYMVVTNRTASTVTITGASAPIAQKAELHISREVDGYMTMEPVPSLALVPGQTAQLAPGGMHMMLMGLESMPAAGSSVQLCLEISTGQSTCVDAAVQRDAGSTDHQHKH